jgi:hypothetical protein
MVRGRLTCSFWRASLESPRSSAIIEASGKRGSRRGDRRDVGGLAGQIDLVLGVDLELLGDLRRDSPSAARSREIGDRDIGVRQQLESAAPLPVLVERETVRSASLGVSDTERAKSRAAASAAIFLGVLAPALGPDAADRDAAVGQALIRIVRPAG